MREEANHAEESGFCIAGDGGSLIDVVGLINSKKYG